MLYISEGVVPDVAELLELELELLELLELLLPELPEPLLVELLFDDELLPVDELLLDPDVPPDVDAVAGVAARYITDRTSISIRRKIARARSARSTSSCPDVE